MAKQSGMPDGNLTCRFVLAEIDRLQAYGNLCRFGTLSHYVGAWSQSVGRCADKHALHVIHLNRSRIVDRCICTNLIYSRCRERLDGSEVAPRLCRACILNTAIGNIQHRFGKSHITEYRFVANNRIHYVIRYRCQTSANTKGFISDRGHRRWNFYRYQATTSVECFIAYRCY